MRSRPRRNCCPSRDGGGSARPSQLRLRPGAHRTPRPASGGHHPGDPQGDHRGAEADLPQPARRLRAVRPDPVRPARTGKTTAITQLGATLEIMRRQRRPHSGNDIPAIYITAPPAATPRMIAIEFARFLGLPVIPRANLTDMIEGVCGVCADTARTGRSRQDPRRQSRRPPRRRRMGHAQILRRARVQRRSSTTSTSNGAGHQAFSASGTGRRCAPDPHPARHRAPKSGPSWSPPSTTAAPARPPARESNLTRETRPLPTPSAPAESGRTTCCD